jgi:hypothetical protein
LTATPTLQRPAATNTPVPPAPTVAAPTQAAPAPVSGIRPPSTGNGGLVDSTDRVGLLLPVVSFALAGGLAIGTALRLRASRVAESGRRVGPG